MKRLIFICLVLFAACKTDEQIMEPWKGRQKVDMIAHWGKPTSIVPDGQGGEVYEYATMLHAPNTGGQSDVFYRVKCFYVHADGIVYNTRCEDSRTPQIDEQ